MRVASLRGFSFAKGAVGLLPPPALGERYHRDTRSLVLPLHNTSDEFQMAQSIEASVVILE